MISELEMNFRSLLYMLIFYTTVINGEIYKWTDQNGSVHFTDQPKNTQVSPKPININTTYINSSSLNEQMSKLLEIVSKMKKQADYCYSQALNKKFDISCERYVALNENELKPRLAKIKNYYTQYPDADLETLKEQLQKMINIQIDAQEKFNSAIKYLKELSH